MRARVRFAVLIAIVGVVAFGANVAGTAAGQDELAVVRQVTARFHDIDAAKAAGYELGYLNGAGNRIITGCIAHPTAGVMEPPSSSSAGLCRSMPTLAIGRVRNRTRRLDAPSTSS